MRGFIVTVILFITLLLTISLNVFFVEKTIMHMKKEVHSLKSLPCEENAIIINNISNDWQKNNVWISLSVSYDNIEELTNIIDSLKAANTSDDIIQFQIHIELLLNAIEELGRLEKLSVKNIL